MKTLKELVSTQLLTGKSDIDIIQDWFVENEMEGEGINLMNRLAKIKIDKQDYELKSLKGKISMYGGDRALFKAFKLDVGGTLSHIIHLFIAGYDIEKDYPQYFEWLKETIPTLKCPNVFWREFYDWLASKGIYFLGENK